MSTTDPTIPPCRLFVDETTRQLIREIQLLIPVRPGQCARHNYEYQHCGFCNVFMATKPLGRETDDQGIERKTKIDWAYFLHDIAGQYTDTEKTTMVMDNLSTQSPGALYETYPPE